MIRSASAKYGVPEPFLKGVIRNESGFRTNAVSSAGAQGLMQLMPATARGFGVTDPFNPAQNIDAGARFLRNLLKMFDGDMGLAYAGYNAGPNAVKKYGGIPPYKETQTAVTRVLEYTRQYATQGGGSAY